MKSAATLALVAMFAAVGCSSSGGGSGTGGSVGSGGATGSGGSGAHGGTGGTAASGGATGTGGAAGHGAGGGSAGATGAGGAAGGTTGTGGHGTGGGSAGATGAGGAAGGTKGTGGYGTGGSGGAAGGGGAGGGAGAHTDAGTDSGTPSALHATFSQVLPASIEAPIGAPVAVDSNDTAIVVSALNGSSTGDPGPEITWFPAQGQPHSMTYPNAVTPAAMALDQAGTIWLVGQLYRTVSFGGSPLQPVTNGYYLAHLGADGSALAAYSVSREDVTFAQTLVVDASNNVYVAGGVLLTSGTLGSYAFVTKFSSSGSQIYDQTFVDSDTQALVQGIAIAPNGDVVLAGYFDATMQVGTKSLQSAADLGSNGFFAILDPSTGAPRNSFSFGGTTSDVASSVAVTSAGNLRIVGSLTATSTVGGITVQADPNTSAFIAEVTPTGTANWVNLVGSGSGAIFQTAVNASDLSFAVGHLNDTSGADAIVADVDSADHLSIPFQVANVDGNGTTDCAADHHGGVWVTGEFMGTTDVGTGTLTAADPTLPSNFVLHLQP